MAELWFIRHGESEGNAGLPVSSDEETPLTDKGKLQANLVSKYILTPPDLFVVSPYLRTVQTAQPTLQKFPDVPVEIWPIQEYSYLNHQQHANTTKSQRRKPSFNYFRKFDSDLNLGTGAESLNQFIARVENTLQKLMEIDHQRIILFGHGWFMRATLWLLYHSQPTQEEKSKFLNSFVQNFPNKKWLLKLFQYTERKTTNTMLEFLIFSSSFYIPNSGVLKYRNSENNLMFVDFYVDHLPDDLK